MSAFNRDKKQKRPALCRLQLFDHKKGRHKVGLGPLTKSSNPSFVMFGLVPSICRRSIGQQIPGARPRMTPSRERSCASRDKLRRTIGTTVYSGLSFPAIHAAR
ncbi:hypothetical protein CO652_01435 [Rhizobium sp. H4]|nr:hypothetical protein CO652_01435 [Rhizobium sp. H4]